ncbi:hypothetical protein NLX74_25540 [Paenibacillus sp. MZ03-122A]|nr:hypothetical protein [Paenibacillus sp. MZ03-122A]
MEGILRLKKGIIYKLLSIAENDILFELTTKQQFQKRKAWVKMILKKEKNSLHF